MKALVRWLWSARPILVLGLVSIVWMMLGPRVVYAGACYGPLVPDLGACADTHLYNTWKSLTSNTWQINRFLLIGAYQLHQLRWWLVDGVFLTAYSALESLIGPVIAPIAAFVLSLILLSMIALPLLGRMFGSLRQIFILLIVGSVLLVQVGPLVADVDRWRVTLAGAMFEDLNIEVPSRLFGPESGSALPAYALYIDATCGGQEMRRQSISAMTLADTAAAMVGATHTDIHCPQDNQFEFVDLPMSWYEPHRMDFAYNGDIGYVSEPSERATYMAKIQSGFTRSALTIIPSFVAVLEELIHLVFALAMICLGMSFPFLFIVSFFQQSFAAFGQFIMGIMQVIKVSAITSFCLSLLVLLLVSAANTADAIAYIGLSALSATVLSWMVVIALFTLKDSIETASASVSAATGYNPQQPIEAVQQGVGLAAAATVGAVTGGVGAAAIGAGALAAGGSASYVLGSMAGSNRGLAQVGGLAAAMGGMNEDMERGIATSAFYSDKPQLGVQRVRAMRSDIAAQSPTDTSSTTNGSAAPPREPTQRLTRSVAARQPYVVHSDDGGMSRQPRHTNAQDATQRLSEPHLSLTPAGQVATAVHHDTADDFQECVAAQQETNTARDAMRVAQHHYAAAEDAPQSTQHHYMRRLGEHISRYSAARATEKQRIAHYQAKVRDEISKGNLSPEEEERTYQHLVQRLARKEQNNA
ncbi:MAG: hypothetical protein AAGF35_11910 [Pseudomonadota bacterium]